MELNSMHRVIARESAY